MGKQEQGQRPLFGYMMNALRDVLGNPEERAKAIEEFKAQNVVPEGTTDFGKAFAKFMTDRVAARAEESRARDEACRKEPSEG